MLLGQEFKIKDWVVKVLYIVDTVPKDYVYEELLHIGCPKETIYDLLVELDNLNVGFTYSDSLNKKALLVIGATSSPEQFQHTFDHEKIHLAMHISKEESINPYSETLAYLVGDIGSLMFPIAKKFLCEHCREDFLSGK